MIPRRSLLVGALSLAGCASLPPSTPYPSAGPSPELEPLSLVRSEPDKLVIEIESRGCLARPDLVFHVERKGGAATIAFARRRLQTCHDQAPVWTEVTFTKTELGLSGNEPVFVLNPIAK